MDMVKSLRAFTSKHRPTVAEAGIRALGVLADPTRAECDVLLIFVRPRLDSPRVETSFWVTEAGPAPIASFPKSDEMRGQLKLASDQYKQSGLTGALLVVLMETDSGTCNIAPVGYSQMSSKYMKPLSTPWKEWLTGRMNEGLVV
jgi:hypothetical protein